MGIVSLSEAIDNMHGNWDLYEHKKTHVHLNNGIEILLCCNAIVIIEHPKLGIDF